MKFLSKGGFKVLPLDVGLLSLRTGTLPRKAIVITIDDGFKSTLSVASPILASYGFQATVYVATYYVEKQVPIFRLAVKYVFWKARDRQLDLRKIAKLVPHELFGNFTPGQELDCLIEAIVDFGESLDGEQRRQELLRQVAMCLEINLDAIFRKNSLSLLSPEELRHWKALTFDVQLHTHRHQFPLDDQRTALLELEENRARICQYVGIEPRHFCYPSGIFSPNQWQWLESAGILSASTCELGLNDRNTPPFALRRFLDSESISDLEYRAELSGFTDLLRKFVPRPKTLRPMSQNSPD